MFVMSDLLELEAIAMIRTFGPSNNCQEPHQNKYEDLLALHNVYICDDDV